jgi:putative mRNA 3-end processing factor
MKIKILGSGQEVGRSAILLEGQKKVMLDCGVKIEPEPPQYPRMEKVDAAVISHAHLDHVGAMPLLAQKGKPKIFMNDVTMELGAMLIKDSIKVAKKEGFGTPFSKKDLRKSLRLTKIVSYREKFRIGDTTMSLWPSGHIPGSSAILAEGRKKVFYTSDIQTTNSHLMRRCQLPDKVDVLIVESTYGQRNHRDRELLEKDLINAVEEALAKDEVVLFPAFAIGRAQEVMMILERYANKIALDGMAKLASEIIAEYGSYLRDAKSLRNVLRRVKFIRNQEDRVKAIRKYPIIISSAGMLGGGPAVHYLREISRNKGSKVVFTGFLVDDTPGRNLMETGIFKNSEEEFNVHCDLHQFELSAHTDRKGIFDIINHTKPETVICVHGEHCDKFAKDIEEHFGVQAYAPANGESIKV